MSVPKSPEEAPANHLLRLLPPEEYQRIAPSLQVVRAEFKQVIFERHQAIEWVYLPIDSVFSVLTYMHNGDAVEVGTIGNEGLSGIDLLIGADHASETTICQVAGQSLRMRAADFRQHVATDTPLRRVAMQFLQVYLGQVSQSVACNRLHTIEERFARWVLMTHDRVRTDRFHLTQEFLADMLGVHRPSVSLVASAFQQAGLIRYSRGNLTIVDRAGLEGMSCECYGVVKERFQRVLGLSRS